MAVEALEFIISTLSVPGFWHLCGVMAITAAILTPLERLFPAHPQPCVLRRELSVDLAWWFFTPIFTRLVTNVVLAGALLVYATVAQRPLDESLLNGFGPVARQPLWLQTIEMLVLADFIDYWTHRCFHLQAFWPIHAVHHSPEEMNWISSSRVHPLNDVVTRTCQVLPLMMVGFSPSGVILIVPYITFYVMFLHSNISCDFGPFRWLLVSPTYHRWHHTRDSEGIDRNFAGIFPLWDVTFGTAYFPRHLPRTYGVKEQSMPKTFWGQVAHPFRHILGILLNTNRGIGVATHRDLNIFDEHAGGHEQP